MAASSLSPSFAYTAATALPEPHSRTQYGCVPASRSYSARSGGCFPKTGISKSLPPSRPMLPHPANASASSSSGPRGAGSGCISSHQPYASGVATGPRGGILPRRPEAGPVHGERAAPPAPPAPPAGRARHHQVVRQLEQGERRLDLVIPRRPFARENAQQQIELGVRGDADPIRGGG